MRYRRPLAGLVVVLLGCAVLGALGLNVEEKLAPLSLEVRSTGRARTWSGSCGGTRMRP